jgi:hypothetical protein
MDDEQQWSKAQLAWPSFVEMENDEMLRANARFGGEALSRLCGCWDAPPKQKERPEPPARLDTPPARPVLIRHGQEQPILVEMPWGKDDWK